MERHHLEQNHLQITGQVTEVEKTRFSPGGIPHRRFVIEHRSRQVEAGYAREARCLIFAQIVGEELQKAVSQLHVGSHVSVTGFLARSSFRDQDYQLLLHVQSIDCLKAPGL